MALPVSIDNRSKHVVSIAVLNTEKPFMNLLVWIVIKYFDFKGKGKEDIL
jgi:hypothetical protein